MKQWLSFHPTGLLYRDCETGMAHGNVRWPEGQPPTPFGCRWCGAEQRFHGRRSLRGRNSHWWTQPTQAQMKARMLARRNARKAVCRCPQGDEPRPFAPVVDPYSCEADDCHGYFSELSPFGVQGGPVYGHDAKVSRVCGTCGWRTSVWHVDDGSAEVELSSHVARVHGGVYPAETGGAPADPRACNACGSLPEQWCPDCGACESGCHGGLVDNPCTHASASWGASC